jgi:hypothetical protein
MSKQLWRPDTPSRHAKPSNAGNPTHPPDMRNTKRRRRPNTLPTCETPSNASNLTHPPDTRNAKRKGFFFLVCWSDFQSLDCAE